MKGREPAHAHCPKDEDTTTAAGGRRPVGAGWLGWLAGWLTHDVLHVRVCPVLQQLTHDVLEAVHGGQVHGGVVVGCARVGVSPGPEQLLYRLVIAVQGGVVKRCEILLRSQQPQQCHLHLMRTGGGWLLLLMLRVRAAGMMTGATQQAGLAGRASRQG
jgi:hypothetical protein